MGWDVVLMVFAALLMVVGVIGCFVPFLPGPPLNYVGLLLAHFTHRIEYSNQFLLLWAVVVIVVSLLDYLIPIWGAKTFGGTKAGTWGSGIGLLLGVVLFPPWGIVIGPVVGAFAGEIIANRQNIGAALKAGAGALAGFVLGTALKLAVSLTMCFYFVKETIAAFWV